MTYPQPYFILCNCQCWSNARGYDPNCGHCKGEGLERVKVTPRLPSTDSGMEKVLSELDKIKSALGIK